MGEEELYNTHTRTHTQTIIRVRVRARACVSVTGVPVGWLVHMLFWGIKRKGELKQKQFMSVSTPGLSPLLYIYTRACVCVCVRTRVALSVIFLRLPPSAIPPSRPPPPRPSDPLNLRKNVPWLLKVIRSCFYMERNGRAGGRVHRRRRGTFMSRNKTKAAALYIFFVYIYIIVQSWANLYVCVYVLTLARAHTIALK